MIHIFFVPGMFGSTIEYVLRDFTKEMIPTNAEIAKDGSMHTFKKQNHPSAKIDLVDINFKDINTPMYPFTDAKLSEILKSYPVGHDDFCILVYAKTFEEAERNMLFIYHKIVCGQGLGLKTFYGSKNNAKSDVSKWDQSHNDYSDLAIWEFREWFSIYYPSWVQEWQDSYQQVPDYWLKISPDDLLYRTKNIFERVIDFCNLTKKCELDDFVIRWQQAQQYILDEYALINNIVDLTINQKNYTWKSLHPIAEAIIQKKLRDHGFELRCNGLNIFPTNSIDLYNLLYKQL